MEKMTYDEVTPEWLREKIKESGLTQAEFGRYFSNSRGDISAYCSGAKSLSLLRRAAFYWFFEARKEVKKE
jgi:hypothetical protein